jgi:hypothetical protein
MLLVVFSNIAWVGFVVGLGVYRKIHGLSVMDATMSFALASIGMLLAIGCPVLANCLRPHPLRRS